MVRFIFIFGLGLAIVASPFVLIAALSMGWHDAEGIVGAWVLITGVSLLGLMEK